MASCRRKQKVSLPFTVLSDLPRGQPLQRLPEGSARIISKMSDLSAKTCVPCRGGVPPLKGEELVALQKQVDGWSVIEEHHIAKTFKFPNFREALKFVVRVGELAEEQGHHPDIFLAWGKVEITVWTHKINGLTESDFILAAKIDQRVPSENPVR